jgi:prepilin-type N-terminal cleavage/methylation domain-containing protein
MDTRNRAGFIPRSAGFTLIELLVAMSMLVMIIMIVGMFFQRASVAWDTGVRKAEVLLTGRAVADYMAQEMQMAMPTADFDANSGTATFMILGEATGSLRATQLVSYALSGSKVTRKLNAGSDEEMCDGVEGLNFEEGPVNGSDILPRWVNIQVTVSNEVGPPTVFQSRASFPNRGRDG